MEKGAVDVERSRRDKLLTTVLQSKNLKLSCGSLLKGGIVVITDAN